MDKSCGLQEFGSEQSPLESCCEFIYEYSGWEIWGSQKLVLEDSGLQRCYFVALVY